ncbi:hypothetical protein [Peribacillus simplex]
MMNNDLYRSHRIAVLKLEEESLTAHSNLIEKRKKHRNGII